MFAAPGAVITKPLLKEVHRRVYGNGLLTSNGTDWLRHRRLLQPAFHERLFSEYSRVVLDHSDRMLAARENEETRDIHEAFIRLSCGLVLKSFLNVDAHGSMDEIVRAGGNIVREFDARLIAPIQIPLRIPK